MSLLPSKFQPESLPSLGKLVAKAIAPKPVDPIKAFEIGDHGSKSAAKLTYGEIIGAAFLRLSHGICSANGAALIGFNPSPQAVRPAPFKVGDKFRVKADFAYLFPINEFTVTSLDNDCAWALDPNDSRVSYFNFWNIEPLAPSQEAAKGDADGWVTHVPGPAPHGLGRLLVKFKDGKEIRGAAGEFFLHCWTHEGREGNHAVAYRVLP